MSEEIRLNGIGVAPGVLETIVTLAAEAVDGVEGVCAPKLARVVHQAGKAGVAVEIADDALSVALHISVAYGRPVREVASEVQAAVADALQSQTGQPVSAVDVFVDSISFAE